MTEKFCGLCQANGLKRQLVLFQLNLEEAILLCENKEVCAVSFCFLFISVVFYKVSVAKFGG